jgi:starch synthase (maltosyl-transferring)
MIGAGLVAEESHRAARSYKGGRPSTAAEEGRLSAYAEALRTGHREAAETALSADLAGLMQRYADRRLSSTYAKELLVTVDRERARFGAWYESFPRSTGPQAGWHGTFRDLEARLPYIASMGFDVLYLPPIHPIGQSFRKGRNNQVGAGPDGPGSPWAVASAEGGHKSIHPQLGTQEDFRRLVTRAGEHGLEIALDLAFQTSPDHPHVRSIRTGTAGGQTRVMSSTTAPPG